MPFWLSRLPILLALVGATSVALADVLVGKNGERLIGTVVEKTADYVVFQSELGGLLTVPIDRIETLQTETPKEEQAVTSATSTNVIEAPAEEPTKPPIVDQEGWRPTLAFDDGSDWIQLKSGEWLRGKLKIIQDEEVEFDSEEMDLQTFDWEDVHVVYSPRASTVRLTDRSTVVGPLLVTREEVRIEGDEPLVFPRAMMLAATPGRPKERNFWSADLSLGVSLRRGNTDQSDFTAGFVIQRRTPVNRLRLEYSGAVSEVDGVENANNHRATTMFDVFLTRRLFITTPFAKYYRDPFQNISHQLTIGAGVGYDLIKRPKVDWNISTGPAYQHTWYESVEAGSASDEGNGAIVFGTSFELDITRRLEFLFEYQGQWTRSVTASSIHHTALTLDFEVTHILDFEVSLIWDRVSDPRPASDGTTPEPDDIRLVVGLGLEI